MTRHVSNQSATATGRMSMFRVVGITLAAFVEGKAAPRRWAPAAGPGGRGLQRRPPVGRAAGLARSDRVARRLATLAMAARGTLSYRGPGRVQWRRPGTVRPSRGVAVPNGKLAGPEPGGRAGRRCSGSWPNCPASCWDRWPRGPGAGGMTGGKEHAGGTNRGLETAVVAGRTPGRTAARRGRLASASAAALVWYGFRHQALDRIAAVDTAPRPSRNGGCGPWTPAAWTTFWTDPRAMDRGGNRG